MKRISKIDPDTLTGEPRKIFERWQPDGKPLNIVLIYFRNVELNRTWSYMATHLFLKNSLTDRQREIIVLRISWQCASDYEFIQHVRIAREGSLLTEEEMYDLTKPKLLLDWSDSERVLSDASDELLATNAISDALWAKLAKYYSESQLIDAVATAGGYALNSMATSSFGVDIESHMDREEGLTPSVNKTAFCYNEIGRLSESGGAARLAPLKFDDLDDIAKAPTASYIESGRFRDFFLTLGRYPKIVRNWLPVISYVDSQNTLSDVDRNIVALRTAARCYSEYEVAHRSRDAKALGLSADEIKKIIGTTPADGDDLKRTLLIEAVDELVEDKVVSDDLWGKLLEHYSEEQLMDIVFGCAIGLMLSWMQNAFFVQLEDGVERQKLPA